MIHLERITTEYIPLEDRIRISGQIPKDRTVTIWLTQRMLSLLLPHLFGWLNKKFAKEQNSKSYNAGSISDIIQTFEQEAAIANLAQQDQTPVTTKNSNDHLLVHSIDITTGDLGIQIGFKSETMHQELQLINLTMEHEPLRQWLHILYALTLQAGWTVQGWPDWMNNAEHDAPKARQFAH